MEMVFNAPQITWMLYILFLWQMAAQGLGFLQGKGETRLPFTTGTLIWVMMINFIELGILYWGGFFETMSTWQFVCLGGHAYTAIEAIYYSSQDYIYINPFTRFKMFFFKCLTVTYTVAGGFFAAAQ